MNNPDREPSDLQSREDIQRAGYDELCELRNLVQPIIFDITEPQHYKRFGKNQFFEFDETIFDDVDDQGVITSTCLSGDFWFDDEDYSFFGMRLVFSELLCEEQEELELVKAVTVTILGGVVIDSTLAVGFIDDNEVHHPVSAPTEITSFDIEELLYRINDYVLQIDEMIEDSNSESDSDS